LDGWLCRLVCMITLCWLVRHDFWYGLGRNSMNLVARSHGGASWSRHNSMILFSGAHGGASWLGRNFMKDS